MMNDQADQFERRLSGQPLRQVPAGWRAEILAAARTAPRPAPRASFLETCNLRLAALLRPHPKAWAGLAAVWLCIIAMNISSRDNSSVLAVKPLPPSPEMLAELKSRHRLYAELAGLNEDREPLRPRSAHPSRPRSERRLFMAA